MRTSTLLLSFGFVAFALLIGCGADENTEQGDRALNGDPAGANNAPAPPPPAAGPGTGAAPSPAIPGFSAQVGNTVGGISTTDKDGNVIFAAQARTGGADFGSGLEKPAAGAQDYLFMAKYDAKGALLWHKAFVSTQKNYSGYLETQVGASGLAVDASGNIFMVGSYGGTLNLGGATLTDKSGYTNVYVAKFAPDGKHLWSKGFEGPAPGAGPNEGGGGAHGAVTDAQGNVIVTGVVGMSVDFGGGWLTPTVLDAFVVKFDPDGKHVFSKMFDSKDPGGIATPAVDSKGNIYLTGGVRGTVDFGGGPLPNTADPNPAGGEDLSGNAYLVKLGPTGNHLFSRRFSRKNPSPGHGQSGNAIAFDAADNVILAGAFFGGLPLESGALDAGGEEYPDIFVAKFDPTGKALWGKRFGVAKVMEYLTGLAVDKAGGIILAGSYDGPIDFGLGPLPRSPNPEYPDLTDVFVLRLDANGKPVSNFGAGDGEFQYLQSASVDKYGRVVVSGGYAGSIDFGYGPMPAKHTVGTFVAAVNP
jgi:hypothetical protein